MSIHAKRATFVIAILLAFTIWGIGRRVGIIVSGHANRMTVGFVAADALHRLVILGAASAVACLFFYWQHQQQSRNQQVPEPRR
jgi:hypothetical protein